VVLVQVQVVVQVVVYQEHQQESKHHKLKELVFHKLLELVLELELLHLK
jgi:hypothetical protein